MQTLLVVVIFLLAVWYLYRCLRRTLSGKGGCCGCSGCGGRKPVVKQASCSCNCVQIASGMPSDAKRS